MHISRQRWQSAVATARHVVSISPTTTTTTTTADKSRVNLSKRLARVQRFILLSRDDPPTMK